MGSYKITLARGQRPDRATISAGSAEAQSDTMSLNIDYTKLSRGDALTMIDQIKQAVFAQRFPPAASGPPSLTITFANPNVSIPEGNTGTTTVTSVINVNRNGVTGALTINLTYGGTATNGVDYATAPTSLTIGAGVSTGSFDILINGDTTVEPDETIVISAVEPTSGATASKTITVTNDDAAGYTFINTEASAFITRTNPNAPNTIKAAYDQFVSDLKSGPTNGTNQWAASNDFLVIATPAGSPMAMANLMGNTALDPTYSTNVPLSFPLYGPTSNGFDSYAEIALAPSGCTYLTRDDASLFFVNRNPDAPLASGTFPQLGIGTGANLALCGRNSSGNAVLYLNDSTASAVATGITDGSGTHMGVRVTGGIKRYFKNGVQPVADITVASTAPLAVNFRLGHGRSVFAQDQYLMAGAGRSRTAAEAADFHAAVLRFKTAIGWQALTIATSTVAAPATQTTLPDITTGNPTVTGRGFNPTGFTGDLTDTSFWVSDFGKELQGFGEASFTSRIVHLNATRDQPLSTIDLNTASTAAGTPVATNNGFQGITERATSHNLYAVQTGVGVHQVTKAGVYVGLAYASTTLNCLAWDTDLDQMITGGTQGFKWYNPDGTNPTVQPNVVLPAPYLGNLDQISYDSAQKAVYGTGGPNGSAGFIIRVGKADQNYGWWRISAAVTLTGDNQIEGHVRRGGILYTADDSYGHGSGGAGFNHTATRVDPFA